MTALNRNTPSNLAALDGTATARLPAVLQDVLIALALIVFSLFFRFLTGDDEIHEEDFIMMTAARHILAGEWPILHFAINPYESHGIIIAAFDMLFGINVFGYFLPFALMSAVAVGVTYVVARRLSSSILLGLFAAFVVIAFDTRLNNTYKVVALAFTLLAMWMYFRDPRPRTALLFGLVAGASAFLRLDLGALAGAAFALSLLFAKHPGGWPQRLRHALYGGGVLLACLLPLIGALVVKGKVADYPMTVLGLNYAPEPTKESWAENWLPFPFLGRWFHRTGLPLFDFSVRDLRIEQVFAGVILDGLVAKALAYYAFLLTLAGTALLAVQRYDTGPETTAGGAGNGRFLAAFALLGLLATVQLVRGDAVDGTRLQDISPIVAVSWVIAAGSLLASGSGSLCGVGRAAVALLCLFALLFGQSDERLGRKTAVLVKPASAVEYVRRVAGHLTRSTHATIADGQDHQEREALAGYLDRCIPPDRRVFTTDYSLLEVPFLSGHLLAGGHMYFYPRYPAGYLVSDAETVERLNAERPAVIFGQARAGVYYDLIPKNYPLVWRFMSKEYVRVWPEGGTVFDQALRDRKIYYFLYEKGKVPSGRDERLGLPCFK